MAQKCSLQAPWLHAKPWLLAREPLNASCASPNLLRYASNRLWAVLFLPDGSLLLVRALSYHTRAIKASVELDSDRPS